MATLSFDDLCCLNGVFVLVVKQTMTLIDPCECAGGLGDLALDEDLGVDLVPVRAAADAGWMC